MAAFGTKPSYPQFDGGSPLVAGLRGAYPILGGAGHQVLRDASGFRNHLNLVGSPTWASGPYGPQLGGFSTANYALASGVAFPTGVLPIWSAVLFANTNVGTTGLHMFTLGTTTDINTAFSLFTNGTSAANVGLFVKNNSGGISTSLSAAPSVGTQNDGQPHVLMGVGYPGSTGAANDWRLYFDGSLVTNSTATVSGVTPNAVSAGVRVTSSGALAATLGSLIFAAFGYGAVPDPAALARDWLSGRFSAFRPRPFHPHLFAAASSGIVFSFAPSGGLVLGGSAAPAVTFRPGPSGGLVLGGASIPSAGFAPAPSGGLILGGVATPSPSFAPSPAGGLILGGASAPGVTFRPIASGGLIPGGSATPGAAYAPIVSGGLVLGGVATASGSSSFSVTPSGGLVLGGSATPSAAYTQAPSGGVALGGSTAASITYTPIASGGVILGGVATASGSSSFSVSPSGGVALGGSTTPTVAFAPTASGGVLLGGSATPGVAYTPIASGGIELGGVATVGGSAVAPPDIRSAIYKSLASDPAVASIVDARIYPTFLPQTGKHPCVVFTVISDVRVKGLSGTLGAATARVQFDLRAFTIADAVALKEALRAKWEGYRGTMQGIEVLWAEPSSEHDFARDPQDASDDRPVVIEVDYFFKYRQSLIPSPTG